MPAWLRTGRFISQCLGGSETALVEHPPLPRPKDAPSGFPLPMSPLAPHAQPLVGQCGPEEVSGEESGQGSVSLFGTSNPPSMSSSMGSSSFGSSAEEISLSGSMCASSAGTVTPVSMHTQEVHGCELHTSSLEDLDAESAADDLATRYGSSSAATPPTPSRMEAEQKASCTLDASHPGRPQATGLALPRPWLHQAQHERTSSQLELRPSLGSVWSGQSSLTMLDLVSNTSHDEDDQHDSISPTNSHPARSTRLPTMRHQSHSRFNSSMRCVFRLWPRDGRRSSAMDLLGLQQHSWPIGFQARAGWTGVGARLYAYRSCSSSHSSRVLATPRPCSLRTVMEHRQMTIPYDD